jgi:fatty acyl-CoA reductase
MDPYPGWINNVYGVTKILADFYLGLTPIGVFQYGKVSDFVPVDMCANAMIAIAWETAVSGYR